MILRINYILRTQALRFTHYQTLGIKPDANQTEIRESYLKLTKKYHPDISTDNESKEKFIKINQAYQVLSQISEKNLYDKKISSKSFDPNETREGIKVSRFYKNPLRTSSYQNPYFKNEKARKSGDYWTDYYSPMGFKRAKRKTEKSHNSFWKKFNKFQVDHGGSHIISPGVKSYQYDYIKEKTRNQLLILSFLFCFSLSSIIVFSYS